MQAIERVSGNLAHDFNNYLSIITGYIKKLSSSLNDNNFEASQYDLNQIQKIINRASSIIGEFLRSNRDVFTEKKVINVNDHISELDEPMVILLGYKISLVYDLNPELYYVNININQLQQSLLNLVINSKDAIIDRGTISIKTYNYSLTNTYRNFAFDAQPGDYVAISIIDTGSGMNKDVKTHIFEPYFTTKENKGTGLGLSSIYGFIRKENGFITVLSEVGIGTTITLFLTRFN